MRSKPESDYERRLNEVVDQIYDEADKMEWGCPELARQSGISTTTVYTIYRLAKAVGMSVVLVSEVLRHRRKAG